MLMWNGMTKDFVAFNVCFLFTNCDRLLLFSKMRSITVTLECRTFNCERTPGTSG